MLTPPISVANDIERILKGFSWCKGELTRGKAKVAWKEVFKLMNQGGLGLKPLHQGNQDLMVKHVWNIVDGKDSLWAR